MSGVVCAVIASVPAEVIAEVKIHLAAEERPRPEDTHNARDTRTERFDSIDEMINAECE